MLCKADIEPLLCRFLHSDPHPGNLVSHSPPLLLVALRPCQASCLLGSAACSECWTDSRCTSQLRTPDGKICILDFGMMTQIEPERSIALVEYIAHLSVKDWTSVAYDLSNLGFVPPGMVSMLCQHHHHLPGSQQACTCHRVSSPMNTYPHYNLQPVVSCTGQQGARACAGIPPDQRHASLLWESAGLLCRRPRPGGVWRGRAPGEDSG